MAILRLPLRTDIPKYEFRVDLEEVTYTCALRFNGRMGRWIMDLKTENNVPVVMGSPILIGTVLYLRFQSDDLPPGDIFAVNLEDAFVEAGRDDLSENVVVEYSEAS